ncbi:MAG: thioredoxin family protein [Nitriliruptorales bacterium]|nr:thioredoxin family protein [Nitriliruptorales bacterium]
MDLLLRAAIVGGLLLVTVALGVWWQRRDGRVKAAAEASARRVGGFSGDQLAEVGLDREGAEALGLLLGSPTCAPCEQVKEVLGQIEADRSSFRWAYIDAGDHLALAREHHVMRVPTLFLIDPRDGRILARTSGVPARRDLEEVLDR